MGSSLSDWKKRLAEFLWLSMGVFFGAWSLQGFLLPNSFIDGGATGIALLIAETTNLDLSYLILLTNVPFVILGYIQMSRTFVIKTVICVVIMSMLVAIVDFPVVTNDKLLISVFGGFFLGLGIGFSMRGGAVIDGTEILALYMSRRLNLSIGDIVLFLNAIIFVFAIWLLGVEAALYSMLTYFIASKTVDIIIQGVEEYLGLMIISANYEGIKSRIKDEMNTGVTILNGEDGFGSKGENPGQIKVLYSVITRLELLKIRRIMEEEDPEAFLVVQGVRDVKGGMLKRKRI